MPKWIKIITLLLFTSLITLFVAYRAGIFKEKETPKNESNISNQDSVTEDQIIPSSKYTLIPLESGDNTESNIDSSTLNVSIDTSNTYMGGSKSLMIVEPLSDFSPND